MTDKEQKACNERDPEMERAKAIAIRTTALSLSVQSLKSAGHPNPVDVMSRAEKFKAYILEGKIS
jgi:hypothetical protein